MKTLFRKFFGLKTAEKENDIESLTTEVLRNLIEKSGLELSFDIDKKDGKYFVEIYGKDEPLLLSKGGQLLNAFHLFLKRVLQHNSLKEKGKVIIDCGGFREKADQSLIELAKKLKGIAVKRGEPVYFKALSPRDRKVIHQYISGDYRVKSSSVGEGLYKKVKICPVKGEERAGREPNQDSSL